MPRIHPIFGIVAVPLLACVVLLLLNWRESTSAAGVLGNDMHMSKLTEDLNDQDPVVRQNSIEALAALGKPAVSPLVAILESSNSDVKQNAAERALGKIGEPSVEPLVGLFDASDSDTRQRAIQALGFIGSPATEPLVAAAMDSMGSYVNNKDRGIEKVFVAIGGPAVDRLIDLLNLRDQEDGWHARWCAATALGEIKAARAIGPLRATGKSDKDRDVRRAAIQAIAAIEKAAPSSASAHGDSDSAIRAGALNSSEALKNSGQVSQAPSRDTAGPSPDAHDKLLALHLAKAKALWSSGNYEEALGECDAALKLDPSNDEASALRQKYTKAIGILNGSNQ